MNKDKFYHVLKTAMTWDNISDENMTLPTFDTQEETDLFNFFLDMFNNGAVMYDLSCMASVHHYESQELPF